MMLKNFQSSDETAKTRYIVQSYLDSGKPFTAHDVSGLRTVSIKFVMTLAAICWLRVFYMT